MDNPPANPPDVLVLGMPSSGKTVFLSVLGRNFTLVADDSDARPLGFRMRAIGRSTQEAVSRNYARLLGGEWPASTVAGSVTPLTWDVFTGERKVFTLSSMDVSGESFVKAFCEGGGEAAGQGEGDGLLDMAQSEAGTDTAVRMLRELAVSAKVICFFVNIAAASRSLLGGGRRTGPGTADADATRNYEEGVASICSLLDELPSLRSRTLVVLTQAHRHQSEIERAGGPSAFLGRVAPSLRQSVDEFGIPVIAVSAINERDSEFGFDEDDEDNSVPESIESDGLFGFLLVVAGMIPDARLAYVKDCYLQFLSDKAKCLQLMSRTVLDRLPLVKAYARSGQAFEKACLDYLGDVANVNSEGRPPLSRPVVDLYRRCTASDKDVASAASAWKLRLAVDSAWDRVLRRIVLAETRAVAEGDGAAKVPVAPGAREIAETVRGELAKGAVGGGLADAALYGFERDDLDPVRDAADEESWVVRCLEEFRLRMAGDLGDCLQRLADARRKIAAVDPMQGDGYAVRKEAAVEAMSKYKMRLADFRGDWHVDEAGGLPQLEDLEQSVGPLSAELGEIERRHAKWTEQVEADRQRQAVARERARAAEEMRAAARRRAAVLRGAGAAAVVLLAVFLAGRHGHVKSNEKHLREAYGLYNNGDFLAAEAALGNVEDHPWHFIRRNATRVKIAGTEVTFEELRRAVSVAAEEKRKATIAELKGKCTKAKEDAWRNDAESFASSNSFFEARSKFAEAERLMGDAKRLNECCNKLEEALSLYANSAKIAKIEAGKKIEAAEQAFKSARDAAIRAGAKDFDDAWEYVQAADGERDAARKYYAAVRAKESVKRFVDKLYSAKGKCIKAQNTAEDNNQRAMQCAFETAEEKLKEVNGISDANGFKELKTKIKDKFSAAKQLSDKSKWTLAEQKYREITGDVENLSRLDARRKEAVDAFKEAEKAGAKKYAQSEWNVATTGDWARAEACMEKKDFKEAGRLFASAAEKYRNCKTTAVAEGIRQKNWRKKGRKFTIYSIENSYLNMTMQWCPKGSFTMGSPSKEDGRNDDETQHQVTLTKGFWLGETEVTQGQWKKLMNGETVLDLAWKALQDDTLYQYDGKNQTMRDIFGKTKYASARSICGDVKDDVPVYYVSWNDAVEFCRKLTRLERAEGRIPDGYEYRLPTEAEWEYACRAGTTTALPNDMDIQILGKNNAPALDGIAWYGGNSSFGFEGIGWDTSNWEDKQYPGGLAAPRMVMKKPPNKFGLCDMIGNVVEWCGDYYGAYQLGAVTDPYNTTPHKGRVLRGGGWCSVASDCRSAQRGWDEPGFRHGIIGFRVALAPRH